jgi:hypothetical protein
MNTCVLDSSVIIKGFFPPKHSLPLEIYNREIFIHQKCISLFKIIEEPGYKILSMGEREPGSEGTWS